MQHLPFYRIPRAPLRTDLAATFLGQRSDRKHKRNINAAGNDIKQSHTHRRVYVLRCRVLGMRASDPAKYRTAASPHSVSEAEENDELKSVFLDAFVHVRSVRHGYYTINSSFSQANRSLWLILSNFQKRKDALMTLNTAQKKTPRNDGETPSKIKKNAPRGLRIPQSARNGFRQNTLSEIFV